MRSAIYTDSETFHFRLIMSLKSQPRLITSYEKRTPSETNIVRCTVLYNIYTKI